ncbi:hypothetical protein [Variovorax sp. YR216]|uniref:hypothetical protein n=1 Tax=Variovorax sp. YR216 TaxID=1882828 RepID=UPI00115FE6E7|nr:hypothetical protein [Variovorax sp. YR216]
MTRQRFNVSQFGMALSVSAEAKPSEMAFRTQLGRAPLQVNVKRLAAALASKCHEAPRGLSREEKRKLILRVADGQE